MDNVTVDFILSLVAQGDNSSVQGLGSAIDKISENRGVNYTDGSGSDQCDVIYHDIVAITTADELDFNGVVLKDAFLVGLAITKLKAIYIKNLTGGDLTIGAAANPMPLFGTPATETAVIPNNGEWFRTFPGAGLTIGGATGEIEFAHGEGGAKDVEIIAVGVR